MHRLLSDRLQRWGNLFYRVIHVEVFTYIRKAWERQDKMIRYSFSWLTNDSTFILVIDKSDSRFALVRFC